MNVILHCLGSSCIFGFLLLGKNIFAGETEEQIVHSIYELCGTHILWWLILKSLSFISLYLHLTLIYLHFPNTQTTFVLHQNQDESTMSSGSMTSFFIHFFSSFDDDTIDLLDKLLEYDSKRRIAATDALNHPYFSKGCWNTLKE